MPAYLSLFESPAATSCVGDEDHLLESQDPLTKCGAPPPRRFHKVLLGVILLGGLLIFIGLILALAVPWGMAQHRKSVRLDGHPSNDRVASTAEFQIKYADRSAWVYRDAAVKEWMEQYASASSYFDMSQAAKATSVREQYSLDMSGHSRCNFGDGIRVRVYTAGDMKGYTTVDIMANAHSRHSALEKPFWPADGSKASQKCEEDVHEHSHKFSRESRILLEETPRLHRCQDVAALFPYALDEKYEHNKVRITHSQWWWIREYTGELDHDTKFKISFTLRYASESDARHGEIEPIGGEWSIRIYTKNDGFASDWNKDVVADTTRAWKALIARFGNDD